MTEITAHHGLFKNTNLHVDDPGGSGRPVVLIHGWPLSGESFAAQVPALTEAGYRAITYDRRGFGRSDKPLTGYTYDTLAEDLHTLLEQLDLRDATLVGFSMGGGEVARYFAKYGPERVRSAVFASAVPPYLLKTGDNPDGPLEKSQAAKMTAELTANEDRFYDGFLTEFFSVDGVLQVGEEQRLRAFEMAKQANKAAALACMAAFATTDFRDDLPAITVPTLVLLRGAPHGANVSHAGEWNEALLDFLER
jgi:pimeloyl-ACP methyl ester carboxylesterase